MDFKLGKAFLLGGFKKTSYRSKVFACETFCSFLQKVWTEIKTVNEPGKLSYYQFSKSFKGMVRPLKEQEKEVFPSFLQTLRENSPEEKVSLFERNLKRILAAIC